MATQFLVEAPNPETLFPQIQQWATANGFQLSGDTNSGRFRGTPGGLAGMLIGEIIGSYTVSGSRVTIQVNKNLPPGEVANRLARVGLRLLSSG